jgi:hypothetical protein
MRVAAAAEMILLAAMVWAAKNSYKQSVYECTQKFGE